MGCDIHIYTEVKKNGKWQINTDPVFECGYKEKTMEPHPDGYRSYDWFALLANVRNDYGFARITTGQGFIPISMPKGIPEDATEQWLKVTKDLEGDMHSHSWLAFSEFLEYDWNRTTKKVGVVSLEHYQELKGTGRCPDFWSGSTGGPEILTISEEDADKVLNRETFTKSYKTSPWSEDRKNITIGPGLHKYYVEYYWQVNYKERFENHIKDYIEPMRKLAEKYEDVRFVFGFDN